MFSRTITTAFLAVYPLLVDADCSSFTNASFQQMAYGTSYEFAVANLACSSTSQNNCMIPPFTNVSLTIIPEISLTYIAPSAVSQSDQDAIIAIASQAYAQNSTFQSQPFVNHNVVVSSSDVPQSAQQILTVAPGYNQTVYFTPYFMSATGTLGGCANSALNGVPAVVYAAYANVTGAWGSQGIGPTTTSTGTSTNTATPTPSKSGKPNAAGTLKGGIWSGLLLTSGVFVLM